MKEYIAVLFLLVSIFGTAFVVTKAMSDRSEYERGLYTQARANLALEDN